MLLTKAFTIRLDGATAPGGLVGQGNGAGVAAPVAIRNARDATILVLGSTGGAGRRIAERLAARGLAVRVGSRAGAPPFDWEDQATWGPALCGVDRVLLAYGADLTAPSGAERVCLFTALAVELGVRRLVLLSPRGEAEARCAEAVVRGASAEWTILRSSGFGQTRAEGFPRSAALGGGGALAVGEPFVDPDDVADVAVAVLTEDGHAGRVYELTGPTR